MSGGEDISNSLIKIDVGAAVGDTVKALYDDALSAPAKQVGALTTDAVKTARLLLFPLQIASALQDRLAGAVQRISERVPEQQRIEPPPLIVGPCLDQMRYLDDNSELWSLFEELLTKAVDKEQVATIHPAYPHIISQLSRDEAWILFRLRQLGEFKVVDHMNYDRGKNQFFDRTIRESEIPEPDLYNPGLMELYYSHLESLSLVSWPVFRQEPVIESGVQTGIIRHSKITLTDFGKVFVAACIPISGFERFAKR
jgi:hypothetical protein